MSKEKLSYLKNAISNDQSNRAPWYKNTAPAYAGIILWFVFWQHIVKIDAVQGGGLAQGLCLPIITIIASALVCHFLFYLAPAMFGMKTGLPLYVVGSSIFGEKGGVLMPGLLMGLLQFGWVGVNIYFSSKLLHETLSFIPIEAIMIVWGLLATFMGLKGIKYVAKVSTYLPIIPLAVLIFLLIKTLPTLSGFDPSVFASSVGAIQEESVSSSTITLSIISGIVIYVVGFFATAGAAGTDFGTASRNAKDVQLGGLVGVSFMIMFTGIAAVLILAGAYGNQEISKQLIANGSSLDVTEAIPAILGQTNGKTAMFLLALAAFPAACFSSLIAANSFKTMLPKLNSTASVFTGGIVAIILAITGIAADAAGIFGFIGASFGPICGAMAVDYILSKGSWTGPRNSINLAGWLSWAVGFTVGTNAFGTLSLPFTPILAFFAGAIVYFVASKIGLQSKVSK